MASRCDEFIVYFSVTLFGERQLAVRLSSESRGNLTHDPIQLEAGNIYMTTPSSFYHAVQCEKVKTFHERSVAMQARFQLRANQESKLTDTQNNGFTAFDSPEDLQRVHAIVARALAEQIFEMPTMEEIEMIITQFNMEHN